MDSTGDTGGTGTKFEYGEWAPPSSAASVWHGPAEDVAGWSSWKMDQQNEEKPAAGHVAESDMKEVEDLYQSLYADRGEGSGTGGTAQVEEDAPPDTYEAECKAYLDSEGWTKSEAALSQKFRREMAGTAEYEDAKKRRATDQ